MVEIDPEFIEECKKKLYEKSKTWTTGVCQGTLAVLGGKTPTLSGCAHSACHSWVTAAFNANCGSGWKASFKAGAKNFLVLNCYSPVRSKAVCSREAHDSLILYLAQQSPFKDFILNNDDEKSLTEGGAIILCGPDGLAPAQAMWLCKVMRFITEGAKAAETFKTLVDGGVNGMLAIYIASHIRSVKGGVFGWTDIDGHSTVFRNIDYGGGGVLRDIAGVVAGNFNPDADSTANVFICPKGVTPPTSSRAEAAKKKVQSFCKPFKKSDGWGGEITGDGVSSEDLVKYALKWQEELEGVIPCFQLEAPLTAPKKAKRVVKEPRLPDSKTVYLELDM